MNKLPALFISHGSPMLAITDSPAQRYLMQLGKALPRPKAVLIISAHWESRGAPAVSLATAPATQDSYQTVFPDHAGNFKEEVTMKLHGFVSHGVQDGKLSIEFARNAQRLLAEKEIALTYREYDAMHELNETMQRDFCDWLTQQIDSAQE